MKYVKALCVFLLFCLLWSCSFFVQASSEEERETEAAFLARTWEKKNTGKVTQPSGGQSDDSDEEGDDILPDDSPHETVFLYQKTVSESKLVFEFSQPVELLFVDIIPFVEIGSVEDGENAVVIILEENLEPGQWHEAVLTAKDQFENRVNVEASFRYREGQIPELLITELCTEYSKPRAEFVEMKMLSDGNLEGLQVFIVSNTKPPFVYKFEPVEVTRGQYVVLHLRTLEDACINEYNGRINESGGTDSSPLAWDLWVEGNTELLRKTDAVYVMDENGLVLDAVMIAETSDAWKGKDYFAEAAKLLFSQGAWKSKSGTVPTVEDAVDSSKTAATRTICRDESTGDSHTAKDWYITVTSGATPGRQNNPKRFE